jgi:cytochrome c oxidase subunit IV
MTTEEHIHSEWFYVQIFFALLVLLAITVGAAYIDLGFLNVVIAVTIAVIKAVLVVLYFMHVRYKSRLTWVFAGAAFFWLVILLSLAMTDYGSRSWLPPATGWESMQAVVPPVIAPPPEPSPPAAPASTEPAPAATPAVPEAH